MSLATLCPQSPHYRTIATQKEMGGNGDCLPATAHLVMDVIRDGEIVGRDGSQRQGGKYMGVRICQAAFF